VRDEFLAMVVVEVPRHATERHAVSSHSQGPPFTLDGIPGVINGQGQLACDLERNKGCRRTFCVIE
jgi:hypothetical protein